MALLVLPWSGFALPQETPSKVSSYTGLVLHQWKESKKEPVRERPSLLKKAVASTPEGEYLHCFIKVGDESALERIEACGGRIQSRTKQVVTAMVPADQLEMLAGFSGIEYIQLAQPVRPVLDEARKAVQADGAFEGTDLPQPFTGKGVIVGIVDGGFDFTHPNFYDVSGENTRIYRVWNQYGKSGSRPDGFDYGTEYTTPEQWTAQQTDYNYETHGTHVAGIAAGSGYTTDYRGIAPESDLILVGLDFNNDAGIIDGVHYIAQEAAKVEKPCVINLSLGTHIGPHDGTSLFDQMIDSTVGPGVMVVGAAGNEGQDPIYIEKAFNPAVPSDTLVQTYTQPISYDDGFAVDLWCDGETPISVSVQIYDINSKKLVDSTAYYSAASDKVLTQRLTSGCTVSLSGQLSPENNKYNILIDFVSTSQLLYRYAALLKVVHKSGTLQMWGEYGEFMSLNQRGYLSGSSQSTVGEIGGTGKEIISVGAFCTKRTYKNISGNSGVLDGIIGEIANFSSLGPTADGRVKPDISAPGHGVVSSYNAWSRDASDKQSYVQQVTFKNKKYSWGIMSGTSMASPVVTGAMALWLQAEPNLTPYQAKAIMQATALHPGNMTYPNNTWGAGKLDIQAGLQKVLAGEYPMGTVENESTEKDLVLYPNPASRQVTLNGTGLAEATRIAIYDLSGRCVYSVEPTVLLAAGYVIPLDGLSSGLYLVRVETASGIKSAKLTIR